VKEFKKGVQRGQQGGDAGPEGRGEEGVASRSASISEAPHPGGSGHERRRLFAQTEFSLPDTGFVGRVELLQQTVARLTVPAIS